MTYIVPRQVKAAKACTINKVTYSANQVLTGAQVKAIPNLSALLSSGWLTAVPDVHGRKAVKGNRTPTNIPPVALAVVGATTDFSVAATLDPTNKLRVSIVISGGDGPFSVAWGDSTTSTPGGRTATHTYATAASKTVTVTGQNGDTCTATFTTIAPPVVAFTFTPTLLSVAFDSTVTGQTGLEWHFGDDSEVVTTADPTYEYAEAGTYTVSLQAAGLGGVTVVSHDVTVAAS